MGPRLPSLGESACCGVVRWAPGGSRVMARPGGASPGSSGRARCGACGPVAAGPCGKERPSAAGRRVSPGRVAGGRWSAGRPECCGPVRLGSRDALSGAAGGGLDRNAWSSGPVAARFGNSDPLSGPAAGDPDRRDWSWGPVAVRVGGCACCPGRPGPLRMGWAAGTGRGGRWRSGRMAASGCPWLVRARPATGYFRARAEQARIACAAPRPPCGASQDRAGLACRPPRQACRAQGRRRVPPGARRYVARAAGHRAPGRRRAPGRHRMPGCRCPAWRRPAGPSSRYRATRPHPHPATRPRPRCDRCRATRPHPRQERAAVGTLVPLRRASPQEQGRLAARRPHGYAGAGRPADPHSPWRERISSAGSAWRGQAFLLAQAPGYPPSERLPSPGVFARIPS